jgi:hypothetical protein
VRGPSGGAVEGGSRARIADEVTNGGRKSYYFRSCGFRARRGRVTGGSVWRRRGGRDTQRAFRESPSSPRPPRLADRIRPDLPTLVIGDVGGASVGPCAVRATFADWCGGLVPAASGLRLAEIGTFTLAGVLAGAVGVAEIFQSVRGGYSEKRGYTENKASAQGTVRRKQQAPQVKPPPRGRYPAGKSTPFAAP